MAVTGKYDIFISWSKDDKDVGRRIANRLKEFISDVFSSFVDAFVSDVDITDKWFEELSDVLKDVKYGVMVLTPKALDSAWVNYELGVLRGGNKIIKTFRFSDNIDRTKTPFAIRQDKPFDRETLLDFLTKVYEDKNPGSNKKGFIRSFDREWDSLYKDIKSFTAELDETYERNYLIRNQFDKKISEQKEDIEKLRKILTDKEIEIQKLQIEKEQLLDSDKTQLISALNEKIEQMNADLAKKDEDMLKAQTRSIEITKEEDKRNTLFNIGIRITDDIIKLFKMVGLALAIPIIYWVVFNIVDGAIPRPHDDTRIIFGVAAFFLPIETVVCFKICNLWIEQTNSTNLKALLRLCKWVGVIGASFLEIGFVLEGWFGIK